MITERPSPEHVMVRRAVAAGAIAVPAAYGAGYLAGGVGGGLSATLGVAVVVGNFAAHGLSLAWAAGVSPFLLHTVALGGFVVRMSVIVAVLFALDRTEFFSSPIFGLTVVMGTLSLLVYEARLVVRGLGAELHLPPKRTLAEGER